MKPLRICQVSAAYYPYPSGVTELVHHLSLSLLKRGHQIEILTTAYPQLPDVPESVNPQLKVTRIGRALMIPMNKSFATVPFSWTMSAQVKQFLRDREFDIVHLHGFFPPDIAFYALHHSKSKNVVSFLTVGFRNYRPAAKLFRFFYHHYNRKIHGRIALTRGALTYIQPYFPGEFRIIPPGVDTTRFQPATRKPDANTILFVGRLDKRKGLLVLLKAMPLVVRRVPDARLIVVGRGPMEDEARAAVRILGIEKSVEFKGYVANDNLPSYYSSADVYCSPALGGEAFGIVLIEAMACATPVVASDITGYNEVVSDAIDGLLFPPGDSETLADRLTQILADPDLRDRLRTAGLAKAQAHSWETIAERIETYYLQLTESCI